MARFLNIITSMEIKIHALLDRSDAQKVPYPLNFLPIPCLQPRPLPPPVTQQRLQNPNRLLSRILPASLSCNVGQQVSNLDFIRTILQHLVFKSHAQKVKSGVCLRNWQLSLLHNQQLFSQSHQPHHQQQHCQSQRRQHKGLL